MSKKNRERDLTNPATVIRDMAEKAGEQVDEESFAAAEKFCDDPVVLQSGDSVETDVHVTVPLDGPTTVRTTIGRVTVAPHPTGQTEIKTMAERQTAKVVQQIFRCVYDDQALARMLTVGERDPDVFCPVCGNRMVRER